MKENKLKTRESGHKAVAVAALVAFAAAAAVLVFAYGRLKDLWLDHLQRQTDALLNCADIVYFPSRGAAGYFSYRDMRALPPAGEERAAMAACLEEYEEPFPGAGKRLEQVLEILITAAAAAEMQAKARAMIDGLDVC